MNSLIHLYITHEERYLYKLTLHSSQGSEAITAGTQHNANP